MLSITLLNKGNFLIFRLFISGTILSTVRRLLIHYSTDSPLYHHSEPQLCGTAIPTDENIDVRTRHADRETPLHRYFQRYYAVPPFLPLLCGTAISTDENTDVRSCHTNRTTSLYRYSAAPLFRSVKIFTYGHAMPTK